MKKLLFIIPLGMSITLMACSNANEKNTTTSTTEQTTPQQKEAVVKNVAVNKFEELAKKDDGQILDVRTPAEWESGTIKNASKMNFFDKDFNEQLKKLDKNKPVYVYCKSGGRSGKAAKQMEKMGFTSVYNLVGGMDAWKAAGKETAK